MNDSSNDKHKGLKIVLAVCLIAIISACFIVASLPAYHKAVLYDFFGLSSSVKAIPIRPMGDLRTIATAIEAYGKDHGFYPTADKMEDLAPVLVPRYLKSLQVKDVYGNEYKYQAWREDDALPGPDNYAIGCSGKTGNGSMPISGTMNKGRFTISKGIWFFTMAPLYNGWGVPFINTYRSPAYPQMPLEFQSARATVRYYQPNRTAMTHG